MGILSSLFFFVVAIALLIAIHEYGHFWVARKLGVPSENATSTASIPSRLVPDIRPA